MNRKAEDIVVLFFIGLVIAAFLTFGACKVMAGMMGNNDDAEKDYALLAAKIGNVAKQQSGYGDSMYADLPKDGALVGFNNDSYYTYYYTQVERAPGAVTGAFARPKECGDASSCVCLCKHVWHGLGGGDTEKALRGYFGDTAYDDLQNCGISSMSYCIPDNEKDIMCTPTTQTFTKNYHECSDFIKDNCISASANGGFYINTERGGTKKTVVIENYAGAVGICHNLPCFMQDDKRTADFGITFKRELVACGIEGRCDSLLWATKATLLGTTEDWKLTMGTLGLENTRSEQLSAIRFTLADDKVGYEEFTMLVENPSSKAGPFRDSANRAKGKWSLKAEYSFDEFASQPFLPDIYLVELDDTDTADAASLKKIDEIELTVQGGEIIAKTQKYLVLHKTYTLIDLSDGNRHGLARPGRMLVFYVKARP